MVSRGSTVFKGQREPVFTESTSPPPPDISPTSPILKHLPKSNPTKHEKFLCRPFGTTSLKNILSSLQDKKSRDIDNIPSEVIKHAGEKLLKYLREFYNKIWRTGNVPESLNVIKCVLLHKSGDSLDMLNYRPIAIPSCLLRPITKRLADDMSSIVEREGILGERLEF